MPWPVSIIESPVPWHPGRTGVPPSRSDSYATGPQGLPSWGDVNRETRNALVTMARAQSIYQFDGIGPSILLLVDNFRFMEEKLETEKVIELFVHLVGKQEADGIRDGPFANTWSRAEAEAAGVLFLQAWKRSADHEDPTALWTSWNAIERLVGRV